VGPGWITTTGLDAVTLVSAGNGILLISASFPYRLRFRYSVLPISVV